MNDNATSEPMPAWAKALVENVGFLVARIDDLEGQLRDINAQLQVIGDVDEYGNPLR